MDMIEVIRRGLSHQISGNTSGTTALISSGTFVLAGGNNITLSQNANTVTISAANETQTVPPIGTAVNDVATAGSTGTLTRFAPEDHRHRGLNQFQISGNTSNTSNLVYGSLYLAGGNNITLSQVSGAGAATVTISAANETLTVPPIGTAVKAVQSSGSTGSITRFAPEDHAHQGIAGMDVNGIASTFFGTQQLSAGAMISLATGGNTSRGSFQIIDLWSSATTASRVDSANAVGANASRLALEAHQHAGLWQISVGGNTAGGNTSAGAGSFMLAGGSNITLSGATAAGGMTLSVSAAAGAVVSNALQNVATATGSGTNTSRFAADDHLHQGLHGLIASGTASTFVGDFTFNSGALISFATAGNSTAGSLSIINLLSSATTVSSVATANAIGAMASRFALEAHQHGGVPTVSLVGNTAGNTTQGNLSLVLAGGPNITLSGGTAAGVMTVSVSAAAAGGGATLSAYMPFKYDNTITGQIGQSSLPLFAMELWNGLSVSRANVFVSMSLSSSSNSSHGGRISLDVGIYSRNASTLSLASSGSVAHSWTNTSNNSTSVLSGLRMLSVPININATPGEYWVGVISRTGTVQANWFTASQLLATYANVAYSGPLGSAANASFQMFPWWGIFTAQTAAMPASIAMGGLSGTTSANVRVPVINFVNYTV